MYPTLNNFVRIMQVVSFLFCFFLIQDSYESHMLIILQIVMLLRGVKRKLHAGEDALASPELDGYAHLRQSLLDLSLDKFHQGCLLAEPSLRRHVLITNTLRVIQEDIQRASSPSSSPLELLPVAPSLPAASPAQAATPALGNHPAPTPAELDNMLFPSEEDFSLSASISTILKELEVALDGGSSPSTPADSSCQAENQDVEAKQELTLEMHVPVEEELSLEAGFSQHAIGDPSHAVESKDLEIINQLLLDANVSPGATENEEPQQGAAIAQQVPEREMPTTSSFGSFDLLSSRYLRDLPMDDLFLDIDTSVFERDPSLLGIAASSWPLSCTADGPPAYPSSCNWLPFASSQNGKELNELDNIMEILVGS
ncbi:SERTA domain-containing protein 2-like [Rhinatrema bivittatum]|uniref:SERTA domain-containing protein 2-like n=1 Tax=Rhinatrema bivittatum TaxID=194408 RepID=UPI00112DCF68|nr:SERTA domain-containing protein 2-like [Rhinatrema bivittatum]